MERDKTLPLLSVQDIHVLLRASSLVQRLLGEKELCPLKQVP